MKWSAADQLAITNLYAVYTIAVDDRNMDSFVHCFTPDAALEFEFICDLVASGNAPPYVNAETLVVGAKNIRELFIAVKGDAVYLHLANNMWITCLDGDRGESQAAFTVINGSGLVNHYDRWFDKLARCPDGRWRFSGRRDNNRYRLEH